jgi:hypothetical protein
MKKDNLTSAEKEVFAGIISAGGTGIDLLVSSLYDNAIKNQKNQDQIAKLFIKDVF